MRISDLIKKKRDLILKLAAKHGAYHVRIFGSVARGDYNSESDVDFLVEMEEHRSLFDLGGLQYELQNLLGCNVDVATEKGLYPRKRERILDEAKPI